MQEEINPVVPVAEEEQATVATGFREQAPGVRTFYCSYGADQSVRPSNMQIPMGGERRLDAAGKVMYAPFRLIAFSEGIYRTDDPEEIATLEKMARNSSSGVTEDRDLYLSRVLPKEMQAERKDRKIEEQRLEIERLTKQLLGGREPEKKVIAGPVHSGSVPRRIIRQQ